MVKTISELEAEAKVTDYEAALLKVLERIARALENG